MSCLTLESLLLQIGLAIPRKEDGDTLGDQIQLELCDEQREEYAVPGLPSAHPHPSTAGGTTQDPRGAVTQ